MGYFYFMTFVTAIAMTIGLFLNTMDYRNYRDTLKVGDASRWHTQMHYKRAKKNIGKSRRWMRLFFVGLLLSPLAGILVPVVAVAAAGYGAWRLMYMLFFEKVEASE